MPDLVPFRAHERDLPAVRGERDLVHIDPDLVQLTGDRREQLGLFRKGCDRTPCPAHQRPQRLGARGKPGGRDRRVRIRPPVVGHGDRVASKKVLPEAPSVTLGDVPSEASGRAFDLPAEVVGRTPGAIPGSWWCDVIVGLAPGRIHSAFPAICFSHVCFHLSRLFAGFVKFGPKMPGTREGAAMMRGCRPFQGFPCRFRREMDLQQGIAVCLIGPSFPVAISVDAAVSEVRGSTQTSPFGIDRSLTIPDRHWTGGWTPPILMG
jgi:hypothetical protein